MSARLAARAGHHAPGSTTQTHRLDQTFDRRSILHLHRTRNQKASYASQSGFQLGRLGGVPLTGGRVERMQGHEPGEAGQEDGSEGLRHGVELPSSAVEASTLIAVEGIARGTESPVCTSAPCDFRMSSFDSARRPSN